MKIIDTSETSPDDLTIWEQEQIYNGLDCCVTAEVLAELLPQMDNHTGAVYSFSRALQGPVLEMRLRGVLVDKEKKAEVIDQYFEQLDRLETNLERIVREGLGIHGFNWRSPRDLKDLFYNVLEIPEVKKKGVLTVDRNALEKISFWPLARPIVLHMLTMRDIGKKISVLKTEIDNDGRIRTSYNIAGTETGRFSSSFSEFGTGTNLQNVEDLLRRVLVADPGYKMGYFDAEQGESRVVGATEFNLFRDSTYLDTCESGDLHTNVAKLCWPTLAWTGDPKRDKELAEQPYYRHYSRRFMCKKIGHGTNYGGKPHTLAVQSKVDQSVVEQFQPLYFRAFPAHLRWHAAKRRELIEQGHLISLTGRKRWFFGRRDSDDTYREALAFDPQGSLADIVNIGMLNVWRSADCQLLMNMHDAIVVQYREEKEDEVVQSIQKHLRHPIELADGRQFVIPYGCKTGWNFGSYAKDNEEGLRDYTQGDKRKRKKKTHILDRRVR